MFTGGGGEPRVTGDRGRQLTAGPNNDDNAVESRQTAAAPSVKDSLLQAGPAVL